MKKSWAQLISSWQTSLLLALVCVLVIGVLSFHLGRLTGGRFHLSEVTSYNHVPSFSSIIKEPINAPYYLVRNSARKFGIHNVLLLTRGVSAIFGLIIILCFLGIMRAWYSPLIATLAGLSFALSHLVVRTSRLGLPTILQLAPVCLMSLWLYGRGKRYQKTLLVILAVTTAALLYIPGMLWLILALIVWQRKQLWTLLASQPWWFQSIIVLLAIGGLAPLVYGLAHTPHNLWTWFDVDYPFSWSQLWQNVRHLPDTIAFHSHAGPLITVGQAPLLDVFSLCMVIIGIYNSAISWALDQSKLTLGLGLLAMARVVIGSNSALIFLLIPLYLLLANGLAYLLKLWLVVFPRNPLARGTATALVCCLVLLSAYYHLTNYFVAWPAAPATKAVFSQRL